MYLSNKISFRLLGLLIALTVIVNSTSADNITETIDGITYDVVSISVDASSYDATKPPVFARVKYNKLCPLIITSDDMGRVEFIRNWAFFGAVHFFRGCPMHRTAEYLVQTIHIS